MSAKEPPKSPTPTTNDGTVLPFPDRFHIASDFILNPPPGAAPIDDETRLVLYALAQQAEHGPCKEPKPWSWNMVESAKWNAWSQLGNMASVEAMRLYVKVIEESVQPDWWMLSRGAELQKGGVAPLSPQPGPKKRRPLRECATAGAWASAEVGGDRRPPPRYEHAVTLFRRKLWLIGGNCSGRYLSDVWTLDLDQLVWSQVVTNAAPVEAVGGGVVEATNKEEEALLPPAMQPIAGHALVMWGGSILCIGGHTKNKAGGQMMVVRALDTASNTWSTLQPSGDAPPNRGSHTATMIGASVYVFGGEDRSRRAVNDLYVLDMASLAWSRPSTQGGGPSPRSAHVACAFEDRYLVVFGGGSVARCYNDLWVLDTQTLVWSNPTPQGALPSPRAGHAGDVLDGKLYVVGGGNNSAGCGDLLELDLAGLGGTPLVETPQLRWEQLAESEATSSIASEGLSLTALPSSGLLLAFGGYNGKYHGSVQVFRPDGTASQATAAAPSAQAAAKPAEPQQQAQKKAQSSGQAQPAAKPEASSNSKPPRSHSDASSGSLSRSASETRQPNGHVPESAAAGGAKGVGIEGNRMASLEAAARDATASKEAMQSEMQLMRKQLYSALEAKTALEKEVAEAKETLESEQGKVFKLEVQLAEAVQKLQQVTDLEKELNQYRKMFEEAQSSKGKSGIWNYIAGGQ